jgi:D-alanyl-D-alanine carboxypeptidase
VADRPPARRRRDPLPADQVSTLDAAARSSFQLAAAPGAIVGVRSPEGT